MGNTGISSVIVGKAEHAHNFKWKICEEEDIKHNYPKGRVDI